MNCACFFVFPSTIDDHAEQDKKMAAMLHNGGKHVVKPTYDERFRPDK